MAELTCPGCGREDAGEATDHTLDCPVLARKACMNCGYPIEKITYALGPAWMHVQPGASFPTVHKGTAWRYCRTRLVATPWGESDG